MRFFIVPVGKDIGASVHPGVYVSPRFGGPMAG